MQALILAAVSTIIGVFVAILAARHYYKRSTKHRLAVYTMPSPSIFYGVDPEIRQGLSIQFRGVTVKELGVIEFLIANEGADAIKESIEPLTFAVDGDCRIIDASVTYIHPEGRDITVDIVSDNEFRCLFPLLNPDEYFYIKLITDGLVSRPRDLSCTIVAEGLPPRIKLESAAAVSIGPDDSRRDFALLIPAGIMLLLGAVVALPLVGLYEVHPAYFPFAWSKFHFVWWLTPSLFLCAIFAALIVVISIIVAVISIVGEIPPRQRFKRPGRPYYPHMVHSPYFVPAADITEPALSRYPRETREISPIDGSASSTSS